MRYYILLTIACIVVYTNNIRQRRDKLSMDPYQNNPNNPQQPDLGSTPTFSPPTPPITPLDNPLQAPPQPPSIDGNTGFSWPNPQSQPQPVQPSTPPVTTQDLYGPSVSPPPPPPPPSEAAPTDLSHLVAGNGNEQPIYTPPVTQPETLVTQPGSNEEMPNVPVENHSGGIPKWVIGLGIGILLAVLGTSAYFILGIGKQTESTPVSLPITTKQQTLTPPPSPITAPATSSGSFGELSGTQPATSAADLLKQRQGR